MLSSQRAFAWFSLGVLLLSVFVLRVWRDKGVARRLVAVRDNELGAAALGIPVLRTKLLAFALSGFVAGYAGVCFAFATQQLNNTDITFDPTTSFVIISMVVIGGLGSIPGAILGALAPLLLWIVSWALLKAPPLESKSGAKALSIICRPVTVLLKCITWL